MLVVGGEWVRRWHGDCILSAAGRTTASLPDPGRTTSVETLPAKTGQTRNGSKESGA